MRGSAKAAQGASLGLPHFKVRARLAVALRYFVRLMPASLRSRGGCVRGVASLWGALYWEPKTARPAGDAKGCGRRSSTWETEFLPPSPASFTTSPHVTFPPFLQPVKDADQAGHDRGDRGPEVDIHGLASSLFESAPPACGPHRGGHCRASGLRGTCELRAGEESYEISTAMEESRMVAAIAFRLVDEVWRDCRGGVRCARSGASPMPLRYPA